MEEASPPAPRCANCGEPLRGPYCAQCGQKDIDLERPLRELVHEALDGFWAFDSRVLDTLRLLVARPGALTEEYLAGRRARYVSPLKLYLFVSFLLFLALALTPGQVVRVETREDGAMIRLGTSARQAAAEPGAVSEAQPAAPAAPAADLEAPDAGSETHERLLGADLDEIQRNPERFQSAFIDRLAKVVFLLVPAFAALLRVLHPGAGGWYVRDLVFSLHVHAFGFLTVLLQQLVERIPVVGGGITALLSVWILIYLFLAMRRIYQRSRIGTLLRLVAIALSYLLCVLAVFLGAMVLAAS